MAITTSSGGFVTTAGPVLGTGTHQIQLLLGEDFYAGDVQVTISVNGVQLGGVQSVTAQQANGNAELFTLNGVWTGTPTVSVNFLNDAWNGSTGNGNDRNLYVDAVSYDGTVVSSTVRPVLWSGPVYVPTRAFTRASDFVATIGVTTHLLYADLTYHDETLVLASLAYLGIDHVRDGGGMLDPSAVLPFERAMAAGIKFNFTSSTDGGVATEIARLKTLVAAHPGGITSIEGINEATASFQYAGLNGQAAALQFQRDLYAAAKAEPTLAGIPVINYTLLSQDPADYTRYGDVSATADFGNIHLYPYGGLQTLETTLLPRELSGTPHSGGYVVTEFGYDTKSNASDIQAKYVLDGLLDAYVAGATATYMYELLDDRADPGMTDAENHFGLFNADGTPKPAASALHNLTALLADTGATAGSFTPGVLGYTVTGLPATGNSLLLAKSDGSFDLAVWAEPQIRASQTSASEVAAPLVSVTVTFDQNEASVAVYDPLVGTAPIASYVNVRSVVLGITDHPLILTIDSKTDPVPAPASTTAVTLQPGIKIITGNRDGGVTLAGSSAANSTVTVSNTAGGVTTVVGVATTSATGSWSLVSHTMVNTAKINSYTVSAQDAAGNTGSMAGQFVLASTGADMLAGRTEAADVFAIMSFKGSEIITGFETSKAAGPVHDVIDFSGRGISYFTQLQPLISGGSSAVITIGSGKTVTLSDVAASTLTAADFRFS